MKNIKFAVVLAGCGVFDGAEIHEATMTLYAIAKNNCSYEIFAPDIEQFHVINHLTGVEMIEKRNVLIESARIARGKIKPLSELKADDFDAIIFPGGFGVAKNLSDFAFKGDKASVNKDIEKAILDMHKQKKPIGALCIAPAVIALVLKKVTVTIGDDVQTAQNIQKIGAVHKNTTHGEVTIDKENNVYTTPCYMLDATIVDIANGAMNIVEAIIKSKTS